jgi:SHS2 domain-containing protein
MRTYKFLTNGSSVNLYVEADTLEELFKGSLNGMCDLIEENASQVKVETLSKMIKVESMDVSALLIDFLSDVFEYCQEEKALYTRVKILRIDDKSLEGEIFGRVAEGGFNPGISGVMSCEKNIRKNEKGNWEVTVQLQKK